VLRYEDFVDGDRIKRIYAALRPGSSALTGVLFFDSINRDKKGLNVCFCFDIGFDIVIHIVCDIVCDIVVDV
jgi:hypothetical protein